MAAKYTMRSSNRLKGRDRGKRTLVLVVRSSAIACNRQMPGHDSVFIVYRGSAKTRLFFRGPRIYARVSRRIKLSREGRRTAGKINGNYVCTFAFEESNPPALPSTMVAPFVFRKKRCRSAHTDHLRAR